MDVIYGRVQGNLRSRIAGAMSDILGYARVSTGDQDVAGQALRLTPASAGKVFTDVRSSQSIADRPGLNALLAP